MMRDNFVVGCGECRWVVGSVDGVSGGLWGMWWVMSSVGVLWRMWVGCEVCGGQWECVWVMSSVGRLCGLWAVWVSFEQCGWVVWIVVACGECGWVMSSVCGLC